MPITQADALQHIISVTDESDLDRLAMAIRDRRGDLRRLRAASVKVGSTVRIDNIRPKYLAGMTGKVIELEGAACTIQLDEKSTENLRLTPRGKNLPPSTKDYVLRVPLETCVPAE
ncbi:hypothetical protein [Actinomadura violacea]|uniref:Uncharacterized protein n=1 Tax=Actinomadura violacea TaxID=2819934 RepID=A0ABS3S7L4_9ACTN|nr:hypothetical protein [Actinomadura violacea]MBO2464992.1 hypothetical protein [Actinomadura violacea]